MKVDVGDNRIAFTDRETNEEIVAFNCVTVFPLVVGDEVELEVVNKSPQVYDVREHRALYKVIRIDSSWRRTYYENVTKELLFVNVLVTQINYK